MGRITVLQLNQKMGQYSIGEDLVTLQHNNLKWCSSTIYKIMFFDYLQNKFSPVPLISTELIKSYYVLKFHMLTVPIILMDQCCNDFLLQRTL